MDLRHRHRHAAGKAGGDQQSQQKPRRYAEVGARGLGRGLRLLIDRGGGPAAHRQSERQDSGGDDDSYARIGHAPADQRNREAHQKRPDRSGEVIAGGDNDDREPAPLDEPMRNIRHHRPEAGSGADSDQHMGGREHGQVRRIAGKNKAYAQSHSGDDQRRDNAETVGHPSERDRRQGERTHHQRVGKRGGGAVDAEIELRRRQDHDHRPHARADQGRDQQRHGKPGEGVGAVGRVSVRRLGQARNLVHCPNLRQIGGDSKLRRVGTLRSHCALHARVNPSRIGPTLRRHNGESA